MLASALSALVTLGCSSEGLEPSEEPDRSQSVESIGKTHQGIINGQVDSAHPAVVAVLGNNSACSGTIIEVAGSYGYVLTAAHCGTPQQIVIGTDYNGFGAKAYNVVKALKHPNYNQALLDYQMVTFSGANASTPVIPAMKKADDQLKAGTPVTHVGYGKAGAAPGQSNSKRRFINDTLTGVDKMRISYDVSNGGPCSGDSGGPQLTSSPQLVAGVTQGGEEGCKGQGVSGRVSHVYDGFIAPYLNGGATQPLDCDTCEAVSTSGTGVCQSKVSACFGTAVCSNLISCLQGCTTLACQQDCLVMYEPGIDIYNAIVDCVCQTGCATECAGDSYCTNGKLPKPGTPSSSAAVGSAVSSVATSAAAGGTSTGTGAGGASAATGGAGWIAPGEKDEDYEGVVLSSCHWSPHPPSIQGRSSSEGRHPAWVWLALVGLGLLRRPRISR